MEQLEEHDIQGLVARGYGPLPCARFLLLEVVDEACARRYLQGLCERINTAHSSPDEIALQIAFTAAGLEKLGVPEGVRATFSREFIEGMNDKVRAESLSDQPTSWAWGGPDHPPVHALLLIYAKSDDRLRKQVESEREAFEPRAFHVLASKPTCELPDGKEHFGWRDGISIPVIAELGASSERRARRERRKGEPIAKRRRERSQESWTTPIRAGEFVLGYQNEYNNYTESPTVDPADDPRDILPLTRDGAAKDLGRNGSYLVYREMTQYVRELWTYLHDHSREPGEDRVAAAVALGAKMVGRWPGGAPLITSEKLDDPARSKDNAFTYNKDARDSDLAGLRCPVGAHIRRANPRDHLPSDHDRDDSIVMVRKHQMLRRGRAFGTPLAASMKPEDFLATPEQPDHETRGLQFICLVGHIGRQFEFVQRAWLQSANFGALFKDGDPITGSRRPSPDQNANDEFTCPATPLRRKYKGLPEFTKLVGGAYFFLPGIRALRFIAQHP